MNIIDELLINKYAQGVVTVEPILERFGLLSLDEKREYLNTLVHYIQQSRPKDEDILKAIEESKQKSTYTPCVMLKKGVATHNLLVISNLPDYELRKVLMLFLSLFRIAYLRRYMVEKNLPNKWWYWDLSDERNIKHILESNNIR